MQHQQIVHQHLTSYLRADACQPMARKPTQTAMFFEVGKYQLDSLPPQSVDRLGFRRCHPSLMGENEGFVFTPPQAAAHFCTGGAWPTERTRLARLPLHPVAQDDL